MPERLSLSELFRGWDGYQESLVRAVAPLSKEQLTFRPIPDRRSAGEIAAHIAFGRIDWFNRMGAPGSVELAAQAAPWWKPGAPIDPSAGEDASLIVEWLERSWAMIQKNLNQWTPEDLAETYPFTYWGKTYAISRQWTIWRVLSHDIHHGGQLTILLGLQGIEPPDLGDNHGHIIEPPVVG